MGEKMGKYVKIDNWVKDLLRDPLSKTPLKIDDNFLWADYGARYPIVDGIPDLRLFRNKNASHGHILSKWSRSQGKYKTHAQVYKNLHIDRYFNEIKTDARVYERVPIKGRILDVGGGEGRIRAFISEGQQYLNIDPYINIFDQLGSRKNLLSAYPVLRDPVNFISAFAEHLPLASECFDTVHIRSVLDHLMNPMLALKEAFRVLRKRGQLIVITSIEGGKTGQLSFKKQVKRFLQNSLPDIANVLVKDEHIWHPSYREYIKLISLNSFNISKVIWSEELGLDIKGVCIISAEKKAAGEKDTRYSAR